MKKKVLLCLMALLVITSMIGCNNSTSKENEEAKEIKIKNADLNLINSAMNDENTIIVDVRDDSSYNGFKPNKDLDGGHIDTAVQFPISWLNIVEDDSKLQALLDEKNITKDKNIIAYCNVGKKSGDFLNKLKSLGYENLNNYSIKEYLSEDGVKLVKYPNYELLVSPSWVNNLIVGKEVETYNGDDYVILECTYDGIKDYEKGHVKNAMFVDTNYVEEGPNWNLKSDKDLFDLINKYEINEDTTVIVYGKPSMGAERVFVTLKYLGVKDVRVLNGGKEAWVNAGYKLDTTKEVKRITEGRKNNNNITFDKPANKNLVINVDGAKEILNDENGKLVSVRTYDEYVGKTSGYSYFDRKGRIKGSVWCNSGSTSQDMDNFEDIDGTHRSLSEISDYYKEIGLSKNNKIAFYCGTGWRASLTLVNAMVLGYEDVSLFDDGWFVWSLDPDNNPIEFGDIK
ncbi:MAG: rhodanese-like domain-containing protein [Peptostreptococcaceae bacterium]|jgi:thiosulfate/3-mercaptopyruvate sulfurtransferase|nr:rhodanese-like domain-containing protein [Peptostreptococcaceae bacterium]